MAKAAKKVQTSRTKTPPFAEYPTWSQARFWTFLRSALRSAHTKYPPKYEKLNEAKAPYKGPNKNQKWRYKCAKCRRWYKAKEVAVDHIIPAGSLTSWNDIAGFCQRLFVGKDGLQVLCTVCHNKKTAEERKAK